MTPDDYCQEKTIKSGSSFYYSFLFLDPEQRRAITAVYAFCRQVDDIVDDCRDVDIARVKLQWWRDSMLKTYQGEPQHPIQRALMQPIENMKLPLELFLEIIQGMEMDLQQTRYQTFDELQQYCFRVASTVGLLAVRIFGYKNDSVLKYAEKLGIAFQLTNILRDIKEDAARGRIYIPQQELEKYNISERNILENYSSDAMSQLLSHQAERAQSYYDLAFSLLPESDRHSQQCGIIMAALYRRVLTKIETDTSVVINRRVSLSPIHKLWIAWSTYRRENKRHKQFLKSVNLST